DDGAAAPDTYRPRTTPGVYVPTVIPPRPPPGPAQAVGAGPADRSRPRPPPALTSERWKHDLAEIKALGSKTSRQRTPEQTAIAQFWQATAPTVYWPVARSVAAAPGATRATTRGCSRWPAWRWTTR
ncbi:MAG TPA: PA-phosphatase, partial [Candidatus Tectomicrobia bacterium]|nr:PA-phosphatase [Candidatus Tectomicrobia bacterium]